MEKCKIIVVLSSIFLIHLRTLTSGASINSVESLDEQLVLKWTSSAMKFFDFHRCTQLQIADKEECKKLSDINRSSIVVYVGQAKQLDTNNIDAKYVYQTVGKGNGGMGRKKVYAVLPDSISQKESRAHDVVLALDPYPLANFGHLIGLFYVDFGVEDRFCQEDHQILISDQTCITVATKPRCPNLIERTTSYLPRKCHIDFLPTVHLAGMNHGSMLGDEFTVDLLECIKVPGFASCPKLRPLKETEKVLCDPSNANSKRCDTSYTGVGTRCKLFQTCDRAVLLGGSWNRQHSGVQSLANIFKLNEMLQRNGFFKDNIKIFYGNGGLQNGLPVLSSAMKSGLRGHLRTICESRHCADTFFIYLNNPTTVEGDFLLWDVDNNGRADELEIYKVKEFLSDISQCEAKRVVILADQSNSDVLVNQLRVSTEHPNVVIFTPGNSTDNGDLTDIWANHAHPTSCLRHLQDTSNMKLKNSNPVMYDTSFGNILKSSIIGAPCELNPPLSDFELRSMYQGCQNVPTSVWFSLNYGGETQEDAYEDEDEDDDDSDETNSSSNRRMV